MKYGWKATELISMRFYENMNLNQPVSEKLKGCRICLQNLDTMIQKCRIIRYLEKAQGITYTYKHIIHKQLSSLSGFHPFPPVGKSL